MGRIRAKAKVTVPATSGNLGPGFDVLGIALTLYNELELNVISTDEGKVKGGVEFVIVGEGSDTLFLDHRNTIWQAALKVFRLKRFPVERYSFCLRSTNRIPLSRGLGSSSAAILCGMLAANRICGNPLREDEILNLATGMEGHPDNLVPALFGGFTVAEEVEGAVRTLRFDPPKDLCGVVCIPDFMVSTKGARSVLPKRVPFRDALFNVKRVSRLVGALWNKDYSHLKEAMEDKLHQPYRMHLVTGFQNVFEGALGAGALGVALSGAGPSLFAFAKIGDAPKVARAMEKGFRERGKSSKALVLNFDTKGTSVK